MLGLIAVVLLGIVFPAPAAEGGVLHAEITASLAVALVFLMQGLSLATRQMLAGSRPLRLHLFSLGWNFILYPALANLLLLPLVFFLGSDLAMGFWMLAILPPTIASAIAFTASAHAAVPQSIFASIFSNLLAILVVPLLAVTYLQASQGIDVPILPVFIKLCWIVVLPLVVGQFLRRSFRELSITASRRLRYLPQLAILYIVYLAFAESVLSGMPDIVGTIQLFYVFVMSLALLLLSSWAIWYSAAWLKLSQGERVAVFFTASQKSIATGLPLLTSVFAAAGLPADLVAVVLVPLIVYHPLQLLLGGLILPRFSVSPHA